MTPESFVSALTGTGKSYRERNLPTFAKSLASIQKTRSLFDSSSYDPRLYAIIKDTTDDLIYKSIQRKLIEEEARNA
jgi:hypothetical protein